ncbi:MAG: helix-turn-helix transcriptional regulator [bacterium]|nr:helix-turn-helix transcriptional regulator [bacterium]
MNEKAGLYKAVGERLKEIRKNLGFLQKEFAEELDISTSAISDIEAGKIKPRFDLIFNITKKFNVNVNYLLHGKGDMFMPREDTPAALANKVTEYAHWLKEFLYYFNESEMVRYAMMSYFSKYKTENDLTIEKEIRKKRSQ